VSTSPSHEGRATRHASWLELFFDLVFVAAVAALATQLHADHSVRGLAVFAGLFIPVWWGWMGYTWYATGFDSDDPVFRLGLLGGMLAIAALSAGVAGAASGDSETFVIALPASSTSCPRCTAAPGCKHLRRGRCRPVSRSAMLSERPCGFSR